MALIKLHTFFTNSLRIGSIFFNKHSEHVKKEEKQMRILTLPYPHLTQPLPYLTLPYLTLLSNRATINGVLRLYLEMIYPKE